MNIKRLSLVAAYCALSVTAAWAWLPSAHILVRTKDGSKASAAKAVLGIGSIVAKDANSSLYRVALYPGLAPQQAKQALLKSRKVYVAIGDEGAHVDLRSVQAVTDHYVYLKEVRRLQAKLHPGESSDNGLDWFGAYQHWLKDRVNRDGFFDLQPFVEGAKHRDLMPQSHATNRFNLLDNNWQYVGPHNEQPVPGRLYDGLGPIGGRVNGIAVNPANKNIVFVATAGGGAWRSLDRGITWVPLSDKWTYLQTSCVALDPTHPTTVYVGTGDFPQQYSYSFGIMKSVDQGANWANYGAAIFAGLSISRIVVDPSNPSIVIATAGRGVSGAGDIFRSLDGGNTWAGTNAPNVSWDGLDVSLPDTQGNRTFWAAGQSNSGGLVYKSIDHGASWTPVTTPIAPAVHTSLDVACSKLDRQTVYVLDPDSSSAHSANHIWKTINNGASWTDKIAGFPNGNPSDGLFYTWDQNDYNFYIGTSIITNGALKTDGVFVGLITIAMSPNGGTNWLDVSKSYQGSDTALSHVDQHAFCADLDPNTVYFGNDGGVHRMVFDPNANTGAFTPLNLNLFDTQWYQCAIHPTDQTRLQGGLQDNANPVATGDITYWTNPGAGDGGFVLYDPLNPNIVFNSDQSLSVFRGTTGWTTSDRTDITDPSAYNNEATNFIPPLVLQSMAAPANLFAGTDSLWRWDPVNGWTGDIGGQSLAGAGSNLRIIATCPSSNTTLYTGSDDGMMFKSTNLGGIWKQVDSNFSAGQPIVRISSSPSNAADVLAARTQTPGPNLFRCADTSAANPVWTSVSGSGATALPAVPVNAIARDPFAPDTTWYVGSDLGVFMTTNSGATWSNMTNSRGLPNVIVNDLKVNPTTGYLYAATYGRGLWRIKLNSMTVSGPPAVYSGNPFTGVITLATPAPAGGVSVKVKSDDTYVLQPPLTFSVGQGQTVKGFTINNDATSVPLRTVHITATVGSVTSVYSVYVYPAYVGTPTFSVNPVVGGNPTNCTLTLTAPAVSGGIAVKVTSSNPAVASIPGGAGIIAGGQKTTTFTITTAKVTKQTKVAITATAPYGNSRAAYLIVNP